MLLCGQLDMLKYLIALQRHMCLDVLTAALYGKHPGLLDHKSSQQSVNIAFLFVHVYLLLLSWGLSWTLLVVPGGNPNLILTVLKEEQCQVLLEAPWPPDIQ